MLAILAVCVLTVIVAVWARVGFGWPSRRRLRVGALAASVALPLAFVVWLPGGPLAKNWAARAGTPLKDLQRTSATTSVAGAGSNAQNSSGGNGATHLTAFAAPVSGTATSAQTANGLVEVHIALTVAGRRLSNLDVRLYGEPLSGGGVQMTSSAVSLGTASKPTLFSGTITGLNGTDISARVSSADGHTLTLGIALQIDNGTGAASGNVQVTPE
jgi:hypothetical protein